MTKLSVCTLGNLRLEFADCLAIVPSKYPKDKNIRLLKKKVQVGVTVWLESSQGTSVS